MVKRQEETALNHSFQPVDVVMKYLIVNGDDFGASPGINRGIIEAHCHGILTSASLMVNMPGAEEAVALSSYLPRLSVGLHVDISGGPYHSTGSTDSWRDELHRH